MPWVAEPTPTPDDRLHWLGRVDGRRDATPPGSLSTPDVATHWLSRGSMSRLRFHVRCLPARPSLMSAVSADEREGRSRHAASTETEWNYAPYRTHAQSHA